VIHYFLNNISNYSKLLLIIEGISKVSQIEFDILNFDLAKIFNVQIIPSRKDKLEDGTLSFLVQDQVIKEKKYKATIRITKTGKVSSLIFDEI